jgi:prolyl oligopeptidase
MSQLMSTPPISRSGLVTELIHGVSVQDPYRWLEDAGSDETRLWLEQQTRYARAYLDHIPERDLIRKRIREFLEVETCDSLEVAGSRYFFRKRLPNEEQPSIYTREGRHGQDRLLVNPADRGTGEHTAVKPVQVSPDGGLLLYEIKEGGERTGRFEILEIETRRVLPDVLSTGHLRGFAFAPDSRSFCYVHEALEPLRPSCRAAYHHVLGTPFTEDREIFSAGEDKHRHLFLFSDRTRLGFLVSEFRDKTRIDFYLATVGSDVAAELVFSAAEYSFLPRLIPGKILALTDRDAPNLRIVELRLRKNQDPEWITIVPENECRIHQWVVARDRILVSYIWQSETRIRAYDLDGRKTDDWPVRTGGRTVRFFAASPENEEVVMETESFTDPVATLLCHVRTNRFDLWTSRKAPFHSERYAQKQVWYDSKDGTRIPMFLVGRRDVLKSGCHPAIMTSYGGYGVPMTAQFSVFVAFLLEHGCLFALPNIRGGSEFGSRWHEAAKRRNRQSAYDDFIAAAEWMITQGRTSADRLAIFGGSNSGLLVGAALTQRPDLFRAVVCMVPLLDMLRYHLFDNARAWGDEYGTAEDPDDFAALARYSPYHQVRDGVAYPATLMVSGDVDQKCNPLHARKMVARLQAASSSGHPVLLDYSSFRGHSPVLPLSDRIEALTDRMAFLCDQLDIEA